MYFSRVLITFNCTVISGGAQEVGTPADKKKTELTVGIYSYVYSNKKTTNTKHGRQLQFTITVINK
jgi:hypothetical protein